MVNQLLDRLNKNPIQILGGISTMSAEKKDEVIVEGYKTSKINRTKLEKMAALKGAFAVKIAREKKDPLFEKMIRFKKAYKLTKKQLLMKYGGKGTLAARAAATAKKY
jgi:molybdopterin-guanine dinucleotide biosynthesis protein